MLGVTSGMLATIYPYKYREITTTWEGTVAPYTQNIAVTSMTSNDYPLITPDYDSDSATALAQKEAWNIKLSYIRGN